MNGLLASGLSLYELKKLYDPLDKVANTPEPIKTPLDMVIRLALHIADEMIDKLRFDDDESERA